MRSIQRLFLLIFLSATICTYGFAQQELPRNYYLSNAGDDNNNGLKESPWKTIDKLNSSPVHAGDTVFFKAGETFTGNIVIDSSKKGLPNQPLVITSYGDNRATIDGKNATALTITGSVFITVSNINFAGAGRKDGNTQNGVALLYSHDIVLDSIDVKGFQKSGLVIYACSDVKATNIYAHDNGFAGISVDGEYKKLATQRIYIANCKAENNSGDPTNFTNHSGNGIIVGNCRNVVIEYCTATNNGWDMPRTGNGPVGIWCYEADSVVIQHCIAYRNKTSKGAGDGGGFDLDGGVTNSIIQYCLSYENEGSAFGIFQYDGASNWHDNTIRFCISENDGAVSPAQAAVFIWNSSRDTAQFKNCLFYNNTIYNEKAAAISYEPQSENAGFQFYNNIFVAKDTLVIGKETNSTYISNNWYSLANKFNIVGIKSFSKWAIQFGKEQINGRPMGTNKRPSFISPGTATITDPAQLKSFFNYRSVEKDKLPKAADIKKLFKIDTGEYDFNGLSLTATFIGACRY